MTERTVVAVGAGQAAVVMARTLRRRGYDGRIVLLGDEPARPYQRPPLSKGYLAGEAEELELLPVEWTEKQNVTVRTGALVQRIDAPGTAVELSTGERVRADQVVLATGARPRRPFGTGPRVHHLRSLADADRLRAALVPGIRLVVIGGGFIGLEVAATARSLGADVTVVEGGPAPLAGVLGVRIGRACADLHRAEGVVVRTGVPVGEVTERAGGVVVTLADGSAVDADALVVGVGTVPDTAVAAASGLAVADGVLVDSAGRTDNPFVLAAGDVARWTTGRTEHFDAASRQGALVAHTILGRPAPAERASWFWSDQYRHSLQLSGIADATADLVLRGAADDGELTAFYLADGVVRGVFGLNRDSDVAAGRELIGARVAPETLADPDTDLADLAADLAELMSA